MNNNNLNYFRKDAVIVGTAVLGGMIEIARPKMRDGRPVFTKTGNPVLGDRFDFIVNELYAFVQSLSRPPTREELKPGYTFISTSLAGRTVPTLVIGTGTDNKRVLGINDDPHAHITIVSGTVFDEDNPRGKYLHGQGEIAHELGLWNHPELREFYSHRPVTSLPIRVQLGSLGRNYKVSQEPVEPFPTEYDREGYVLSLVRKVKKVE